MADVKFTPGPWKEDGVMIVGANGEDVCFMQEPAQYPGDVSTPAGPNIEADARLIAASPDLYEALKELRACITQTLSPCSHVAVLAADAALAKADGAAMEWSTDANGEGWFERDGEAAPTKTEEQSS